MNEFANVSEEIIEDGVEAVATNSSVFAKIGKFGVGAAALAGVAFGVKKFVDWRRGKNVDMPLDEDDDIDVDTDID